MLPTWGAVSPNIRFHFDFIDLLTKRIMGKRTGFAFIRLRVFQRSTLLIKAVIPIRMLSYASGSEVLIESKELSFVSLIIGNDRFGFHTMKLCIDGFVIVARIQCTISDRQRRKPFLNAF